ncbi:MAG: hypothetical protein OXG60_20285 [Chloroflexi bacterium]|nr:hypothetical protein [Chloroflexota bacterium]MCY4073637.1 hypothetical protein [Chloroflexota bacterium]
MSIILLLVALAPTVLLTRGPTKDDVLGKLRVGQIHEDDLALIESHYDLLSAAQLAAIYEFLTDEREFADSRHFHISAYTDWEDYSFRRPQAEVILTNLARRDLFLDPARQLNNPAITNMSADALAALVFSQTYVEEKWDHTVPWDGEGNAVFNWIQPELLTSPAWDDYINGDFLYRERVRYWFATYKPELLRQQGEGNDIEAALYHIRAPIPNVPRLAGYSYPIGNQLYLQTAETLLWYGDYLAVAEERYGFLPLADVDTAVAIPQDSAAILTITPPQDWFFLEYPGLYGLLHAPFADELRRELSHPETAAFWNVMRFLHAGARQREGGGSADRPGDNQPAVMALRYGERSDSPQGRSRKDISAFALMTTVYSDSILLDFTNWNASDETLIVFPLDESRSDSVHRRISERNKAIRVVEQIGYENLYHHAAHVSGSLGLGFRLNTQYEDPAGDYLPYTAEEAFFLTRALIQEALDYGVEESREILCNAPQLEIGYRIHFERTGGGDTIKQDRELVCAA